MKVYIFRVVAMEFLDPSNAHQRFSIAEAFDFLGRYSLPLIPEDRPVGWPKLSVSNYQPV
jgi:hypothetical protein